MSQSHNHKHSYEDILTAVGEFGPWQFKRLLALWVIMLMAGAQYNLMQFFSIKHDEFLCEPPETANCTLNITLDGRVIAKGSSWKRTLQSAKTIKLTSTIITMSSQDSILSITNIRTIKVMETGFNPKTYSSPKYKKPTCRTHFAE